VSSLFYILFGEHYISSRDNNYLSLVLLDLLNCKVSHRVDRAQISMYFDSTMSINVIYNLNVDTVPHQLSQPLSNFKLVNHEVTVCMKEVSTS